MSWWTYINGTVNVEPMGRTQAEKRYILDTVLDHLPLVTGSERDMNVYVIQKNGYNSCSSHDEFGQMTNNLIDGYGQKSRRRGSLQTQDSYILVVNGSLRDRVFEDTFREFQKWLCRLAKRVDVDDVMVEIKGYRRRAMIRNTNDCYSKMFEEPTWCKGKKDDLEPNWCEYLMWDHMRDYDYPMLLAYKYFRDEENDTEAERRLRYFREE